MSKTVQELEQDLTTVWTLVNELSEQLSKNNALLTQLKSSSGTIRGQAVHSGVGFPLRRFNVDITDEVFSTNLEQFASHVVLENQNLAHENKQLNTLLKEYEGVLEGVMGKFRAVSHAATQHELSLHSYYTSLLHTLQTAQSANSLSDNTALSILLQRLSGLIRSALRAACGEEDWVEDESVSMGLGGLGGMVAQGRAGGRRLLSDEGEGEGSGSSFGSVGSGGISEGLRREIANAEQSGVTTSHLSRSHSTQSLSRLPSTSSSSTSSSGTSSFIPPRTPSSLGYSPWLGNLTPSGGYPGTFGRADWALEREGEIVRLGEENRLLRELMGIEREVEVGELIRAAAVEQQVLEQEKEKERGRKGRGEGEGEGGEEREKDLVEVDLGGGSSEATGYKLEETSKDSSTAAAQPTTPSKPSSATSPTRSDQTEQLIDLTTPYPSSPTNSNLIPNLSTSPKSTLATSTFNKLKSPKLTKSQTYSGPTPLSPTATKGPVALPALVSHSSTSAIPTTSMSVSSASASAGSAQAGGSGAGGVSNASTSLQGLGGMGAGSSREALSSLLLRPGGGGAAVRPRTEANVGPSGGTGNPGSSGIAEAGVSGLPNSYAGAAAKPVPKDAEDKSVVVDESKESSGETGKNTDISKEGDDKPDESTEVKSAAEEKSETPAETEYKDNVADNGEGEKDKVKEKQEEEEEEEEEKMISLDDLDTGKDTVEPESEEKEKEKEKDVTTALTS